MEKATESQLKLIKSLGVKCPEGVSKLEASGIIKEHLEKKKQDAEEKQKAKMSETQVSYQKIESSKPAAGKDCTTMYVSYAKDLFIAFLNVAKDQESMQKLTPPDLMNLCVKLIKQAKGEFEK
jgi:hypothetical protein